MSNLLILLKNEQYYEHLILCFHGVTVVTAMQESGSMHMICVEDI